MESGGVRPLCPRGLTLSSHRSTFGFNRPREGPGRVPPVGASGPSPVKTNRTAVPPERPSGLPPELTSFVGRRRELESVSSLVDTSRLLTLTGAGGSGKTRLAAAVAGARASRDSGETITWVELASLDDPVLLPAAVAEAAGRSEELRTSDAEALVRILGGRPRLIVLDNCEHLVDACAALVDVLVRQCPELRVLATSREPLAVQGERSWLVPAMSLPSADTLEGLEGSEAARLFVERARDVAPVFELTEANAAAVAEICRRLDGIPLALELAAARSRVLTPDQIRERLHDAFQLLASSSRTAIPRHRTLRAAIEWSHALLDETDRALLRRLAVFRGGATLDAVEQVGVGDPVHPDALLDVLARLVDRSLVAVREDHGAARYSLLETVRQYAAEHLEASGEADDVHARHIAHFLRIAKGAAPHLRGRERPAWVARLMPDIDNFREALAWSRTRDAGSHVALVGALGWFWFSTRHWAEASQWTTGALELEEARRPGAARAALLFAAGSLACLQARPALARPWLEECVALAGSLEDASLEAYALTYLGFVHGQVGSQDGVEPCRRAAAWFDAQGDLYGHRLCRLLLGTMAAQRGDLDQALTESEEGIRLARLFGMPRELGISLQNTGMIHIERGELARAEARCFESLEQFRHDPSHLFIATSLDYLGETLGQRGRLLDAARLLGAAEATREAVGAVRFPINEKRLAAKLPGFIAAAGDGAWREAWEVGRAQAPDRILDELPDPTEPSPARVTDDRGPEDPPSTASGAGPVVDLDVKVLGSFEARVEGGDFDPDRWSWAKPREALVYLLLHPQGATRDRMGAALWPDTPPSRLKSSFHVALHHLRKSLGYPEWVVLQGDRYGLAPDLVTSLDVHAFEDAVRGADGDVGRLREAVSLWRGEILEGESVGPWVEEHRERVGRLYEEACLVLGRALVEEGADGEAADLFHRVVLRDPLREDAHRPLMAAWARMGQRSRALRHFEEMRAFLSRELDAEPEAATLALAESLKAGGEAPVRS